jgi:hypothetical protein
LAVAKAPDFRIGPEHPIPNGNTESRAVRQLPADPVRAIRRVAVAMNLFSRRRIPFAWQPDFLQNAHCAHGQPHSIARAGGSGSRYGYF